MTELDPNVPYEACPVCETRGHVLIADAELSIWQKDKPTVIASGSEAMSCPACAGAGLVPHTCPA